MELNLHIFSRHLNYCDNTKMNASQSKREVYFKTSVYLFESACVHAESGDLKASATLILKALDQERRAGGTGPQVLQLIKPRQ